MLHFAVPIRRILKHWLKAGKVQMRSVASLLIMVMLLLLGCMPANTEQVTNRITYGLTLIPSGIDPHIHASSELGIPLRQVYDTLVYRDPDTLAFVPGLAEEWVISSDGLTYTFTLKQGVTFHDGTPFNAQAVAANLDRIINPDTASQRAAFMLGPYRGYTVVDDYTIQVMLNEPYAPLLDSFAQIYLAIASPTALAEYSLNRYQFHQVGTGPYRFKEYLPGDRIVIQRNPDYSWGPDFYRKGPSDADIIEEIVFRFYVDESTRRTALENGDAQIMGEILPTDARALATSSQFQLITTPIPGQPAQFMFNTALFPTDNLAVRQALLTGLNRSLIADTVFQGFSPAAWGPLASSAQYYSISVVNEFAFDAEAARQLLENAGFQDANGNGFLDGPDGDLVINVIVPNWGLLPQVAQVMQEQWRLLGVSVRIESVPGFNALLDRVANQPYHLVAFDTPGIDPAMLNQYFLTDGSRNWMNYSNLQLDNTIRAAVREVDPSARRNLYQQIQLFIVAEALTVPIREYVNLNAADASIEGLRFDAYGWFPLLNDVTLRTQ